MRELAKLQSALAALNEALAETPNPGVDAAALMSKLANDAKAISDTIKNKVKADMLSAGTNRLNGVRFEAMLSETIRTDIDVKAFREELPDIAKRFERSIAQTSLRFGVKGV